MITKLDEIFLKNFKDFPYNNNLISAEVLFKAFNNEEDLKNKKILGSKIYSEFMQSIETFGILLYSIKNRKNSSIFERFVKSRFNEKEYFEEATLSFNGADPDELARLLDLPSIADLTPEYNPEEIKGIKKLYTSIASTIYGAAKINRTLSSQHSEKRNDLSSIDKEDICMLINIYKGSNDYSGEGAIAVNAYNKIKHGYNSLEDKNVYRKLSAALKDQGIPDVETFTIPLSEIKNLMEGIKSITTCAKTLAQYMLFIKDKITY
ncbi:hypothetical protein OEA_28020 (plasmid) [Priestia megaterium NCT-2]|uniref:hypothetical protein n=1 Tax=Priestia megaterium TaxID=1404 RepID=UPI0003473286|nr:hypothetical protein [Priestia megaterium]AYE53517.1 hypothetical protein OEA_28020 [Priestia megaterium NCT-2]